MALAAGVKVTLTVCDLPASSSGNCLGSKLVFQPSAAVVFRDHGQLTVLAGIGFPAEAAAFTGKRQARLAENRDGEIEIGRCGLALGVQCKLILTGRSIARQCYGRFDVLRLAGLDWDAGE